MRCSDRHRHIGHIRCQCQNVRCRDGARIASKGCYTTDHTADANTSPDIGQREDVFVVDVHTWVAVELPTLAYATGEVGYQ